MRAEPPPAMQLAFVPQEASPVRRQYLTLKQQHPNAILFFQLGDFYETFEEDARTVSAVCDIALTSREMGRGERVPLAGFPIHAAETYIARLVERGYHVAICQQVESPSAAATRGSAAIVRREIIRVITPGTLVDPALLSAGRSNFLAALVSEGGRSGLAHADISTGEFACAELTGRDHEEAARSELWRLEAAECLVAEELAATGLGVGSITSDPGLFLDAERTLCQHFGVASLAALGLEHHPLAARAAAAVVRYTLRTNPQAGGLIHELRLYEPGGHMVLDPTTRDHLELTRGARGRKDGTLLQTLDRTKTPMGSRLLADWLGHPLLDRTQIEARLDAVQALFGDERLRRDLRAALAGVPDLERLAGRAVQHLLNPREALALATAIEGAGALQSLLAASPIVALNGQHDRLDVPAELATEIRGTVSEDPPFAFGEGVIQSGRLTELDELKYQSTNGKEWLLDLERRERERTGVKNLKVGYNRIFGYYIEISSAALLQPLDHYRRQEANVETTVDLLDRFGYQRRQTVASGERFVLPELRDYETRQSHSAARMAELEREIFDALVERIAAHVTRLLRAARAVAELDVLASFADVSSEQGYVRPLITDEPLTDIVGGRHPVVERSLGWAGYIPNDVSLAVAPGEASGRDPDAGAVMLLTGPNMAGKTTFGRMLLLVSLMAQSGCFVPADQARVGLVDRLFLRSGASDDISGGQSTFMVEMTEAAAILRSASSRSLAFFDEVGRGTSTYDGMAIARAIVEFLATSPEHGCRAIFSTHYHELAAIADELSRVRNFRMDVHAGGSGGALPPDSIGAEQVTFTYRVVPGSADRSYGVHVARLAGLPPSVVARAEAVLGELETNGARPAATHNEESAAAGAPLPAVVYDLARLNVDDLTPLEALNTVARLRAAALSELARAPHAPGAGDDPQTG